MNLINDSYISFINLDHRKDRLSLMESEMNKVGLKAVRQPGLIAQGTKLYNDPKVRVMRNRTPGAIGCHYSQVAIMQKSLELGLHAFVMEDDLIFCSDFSHRVQIIDAFLDGREWDVFWLGGTFHTEPTWHKKGHAQLPECKCSIHRDVEETSNPHIVRTYGAWSTYSYIVNNKSLEKILKLLEENVHKSIGIDWLFILLSPRLFTYAFVPGCVRQRDSQSDIGDGMTYFSNFNKLGPHWFQDIMDGFNYTEFYNRIK
jgi:GR25 family glycosyltransferase involved in LPS biosynthesis